MASTQEQKDHALTAAGKLDFVKQIESGFQAFAKELERLNKLTKVTDADISRAHGLHEFASQWNGFIHANIGNARAIVGKLQGMPCVLTT